MEETKKVYIVLSYSGTLVSRIIKFFTKYEYCHASVSFHKDIDKMYSFEPKLYFLSQKSFLNVVSNLQPNLY